METLFFWLSKLGWLVISPESVLLILVLVAWALLLRGALRWAKRLLGLVAITLLALTVFPIGEWVTYPLESRFPANPALPERVDGIIVLGGAEDAVRSAAWDQTQVNDAAERILASVELARRFPRAKVLFTSGSGSLFDQEHRSADVARKLYAQLGLDSDRLILEGESRNTAENVARSKAIAKPAKGETWLLVTSAFHMPRSLGIFCREGWSVIPYPVDHRTLKGDLVRLNGSIVGNMNSLSYGIKEWLGLAAYYATGRTAAFFPAGCGA
jgi:uncharacterized SAM-binding protein YcdF (DUF218 family)